MCGHVNLFRTMTICDDKCFLWAPISYLHHLSTAGLAATCHRKTCDMWHTVSLLLNAEKQHWEAMLVWVFLDSEEIITRLIQFCKLPTKIDWATYSIWGTVLIITESQQAIAIANRVEFCYKVTAQIIQTCQSWHTNLIPGLGSGPKSFCIQLDFDQSLVLDLLKLQSVRMSWFPW